MSARTNWPEWYRTAKKKPNYFVQKADLSDIINTRITEVVPEFSFKEIHSVIDVGCGDFRLQDLFQGKRYVGLDSTTTGDDVTNPKAWNNFYDQEFDLALSSLTLVTLPIESVTYVLAEMLRVAKWALIYEETSDDIRKIGADKWHHDYTMLFPRHQTPYFDVTCATNPVWKSYLFKSVV